MENEVWTSVIKKKKNFTQVSNDWILDLRLSWDSYRLLCYIDMQSDDWMFYKSKIKKDLWFGEQKYTSCMQQLKSIWYISHYPQKNDKNKITNRVIELFYCIEASGVPNQGVACPGGGYLPPYNNTNINNTNINNTNNIKNNCITNFPDGKIWHPDISDILFSWETIDTLVKNNSNLPPTPSFSEKSRLKSPPSQEQIEFAENFLEEKWFGWLYFDNWFAYLIRSVRKDIITYMELDYGEVNTDQPDSEVIKEIRQIIWKKIKYN